MLTRADLRLAFTIALGILLAPVLALVVCVLALCSFLFAGAVL